MEFETVFMMRRYVTPNLALLAGAALLAGCGQPLSDAEIRAKFAREPAKAAEYIADHNAFKGYTKAHVAAVLGTDGESPRDPGYGEWSNNCSGEARCYWLVVEYGEDGRVTSATKGNEGS